MRRSVLVLTLIACGHSVPELPDGSLATDAEQPDGAASDPDGSTTPPPGEQGGACYPFVVDVPFDSGCVGALVCEHGICVQRPEGTYLGPCRATAEVCDIGLECQAGQCRPKRCVDDGNGWHLARAADGTICGQIAGSGLLFPADTTDPSTIFEPVLYEITGDFVPCGAATTTFGTAFEHLQVVRSNIRIDSCNALTDASLPALRWVGGDTDIRSNDSLVTLGTWGLERHDGNFRVTNNPSLRSLGAFPSLRHMPRGVSLIGLPVLDDLSGLGNVQRLGYLNISNAPALESLSALTSLTYVGRLISLQGNTTLKSLGDLEVTTASPGVSINAANNPALPACEIEAIATAWGIPLDDSNRYRNEANDETAVCQ